MKILRLFLLGVIIFNFSFAQYSIYEVNRVKNAKWSKIDFGKMWTFDDIPLEYWQKEYGFKPTEKWIEEVQKSAIQFGYGCSAAFVSEDGLIMTNHHCGRGDFYKVQKAGEDLLKDGFYASQLTEERKIPDLFVDQLVLIEDVTKEIQAAFNSGSGNDEKVKNKDLKIKELEEKYSKETNLKCEVVRLYNGGKYSLYGYKRYNDVRLVMAPDFQIAATGWDWDNFTYPRYELDFAFYRAYDENGKPVKSTYHFTWSKQGATDKDLIFTVGRPGKTDRLLSMAELEYFRDFTYPSSLILYNGMYKIASEQFDKHPEKESEMLNWVMGIGNGRKSFAGRLMGLRDEFMMSKKRDFEKELISKIKADKELNNKFGHIWDNIQTALNELKNLPEAMAYNPRNRFFPEYFTTADKMIKLAEQLQLPNADRDPAFKDVNIEKYADDAFAFRYDEEINKQLIEVQTEYFAYLFENKKDAVINKLYNNLSGKEAVEFVMNRTILRDKAKVLALIKENPAGLLKSEDPFINFILNTRDKYKEITNRVKGINNTLQVLNQLLGEAVFAVYKNSISPDATSTLRISDGKIADYEYNGTIAPGKTTYYGLYDRYNSFDKNTYPWGLHERWKKPAPGLDLSVYIGFASTNDIVGGNSGSSIININKEVVGLVHDGNLESLPGHFLFLPINNRTVASDSWGLLESLKYVFKTDKLVKELETSKLP